MDFLNYIWLIPLFPLAGAALMLLIGKKLDPQPPSTVAIAPGVEPVYEHGHGHDQEAGGRAIRRAPAGVYADNHRRKEHVPADRQAAPVVGDDRQAVEDRFRGRHRLMISIQASAPALASTMTIASAACGLDVLNKSRTSGT